MELDFRKRKNAMNDFSIIRESKQNFHFFFFFFGVKKVPGSQPCPLAPEVFSGV